MQVLRFERFDDRLSRPLRRLVLLGAQQARACEPGPARDVAIQRRLRLRQPREPGEDFAKGFDRRLDHAVQVAKSAFDEWSNASWAKRTAVLFKLWSV